ncbi:hypothetical protein CCACVL1_00838, partial [Corchorus capsularis]
LANTCQTVRLLATSRSKSRPPLTDPEPGGPLFPRAMVRTPDSALYITLDASMRLDLCLLL